MYPEGASVPGRGHPALAFRVPMMEIGIIGDKRNVS